MEFSLNGQWIFKGFPELDGESQGAFKPKIIEDDWLPAQVPGTVHTDLMANNLIPDPFRGLNEEKAVWIPHCEWWYRREIELPPQILNKGMVELVFDGLDTFASIWVNGVEVGETEDMFVPWRFNVKHVAKAGKNVVAVRFKPIYKVASELEKKYLGKYGNLHADNFSARPYVRKAQYSFGWDWGPVLATAGIWRDARILAYDTAKIGYVAALPVSVSKQKATVKMLAEVYSLGEADLTVKFTLSGFGQNYDKEAFFKASSGRKSVECSIEVAEPKLWWPRGYGEPALYDAAVRVFSGDKLLDESCIKVGIRSVELIQESDDEGKTFIFKINGQDVFCKGANWIPADSFLPKVDYKRYEALLSLAADANFNMLRVWGGGVYEADEFYDLCDTLGIMVWQDFMYACAGYPEEEWFLRRAENEATLAVQRLRRHPSIVIWCGNNENQWLYNVLWRQRDKSERLYGLVIFESLLPQICKSLDGTRPYRLSSPFGGEDASGRHEGDRHNWEVWSQGRDYPAYTEDNGRFISEFGWQAAPTIKLLSAYIEKQDLNPDSFAFRAHEKQVGGLELLKALLSIHYPVPADLRRFALYSQLNQAEALKTGITYWRSRMFKTSGCLIWQLNDCWPVISWSLIDYGLNPKAAYYYVKRAYQPIIAPLIIRQGTAEAYVINETDRRLDGTLRLEVMAFGGEVLFKQITEVSVPSYSSKLMAQTALEKLPKSEECIVVTTLESAGKVLAEDTRNVAEPKDLKLPEPQIEAATRKIGSKTFEITMYSRVYAKAVRLDLGDLKAKFSDNFFDLVPKREKTVTCQLEKDVTIEQFEKALKYQAYPYSQG